MKKRIVVSLMLAATMAGTLLTGCGSSSTTTATTSADTAASTADTGASTADSTAATTEAASDAASTLTDFDGNPITADPDLADATSPKGDKVLRVAIECAYAPYNWTQESEDVPNGDKAVKITNSDGYAYGYDVRCAQEIAAALGWDLEIYKSDWSAIFMGLEDGTYDCVMSGMCYTPERDETYDFSNVYYYRTIKAAVRSDSEYASYTGLSDFAGKNVKVTTQAGTNFINYKDEIPDAVPVTDYETSGEAFMAVENQTADVVVLDYTTCVSALTTMPDLKMLDLDADDDFTPKEGDSNDCCICFRDGDTTRDLVNQAMDYIGWTDRDKMDTLMDEMITLQPNAN